MADYGDYSDGAQMQQTVIPTEVRKLRACLVCGLVKTFEQFLVGGCENCHTFLNMIEDRDSVDECTTANFEGLIAMMNPAGSWVAKWQRMKRSVTPGCYAVVVHGRLTDERVHDLQEKHIDYQPLDQE